MFLCTYARALRKIKRQRVEKIMKSFVDFHFVFLLVSHQFSSRSTTRIHFGLNFIHAAAANNANGCEISVPDILCTLAKVIKKHTDVFYLQLAITSLYKKKSSSVPEAAQFELFEFQSNLNHLVKVPRIF